MGDWRTLFEWLVCLVILGIGLWMIYHGLPRLIFRNPELAWTPVSGKVKESFVEIDDDGDATSYKARLLYEYHFAGIAYVNDRIAPLWLWSSFRWPAESYVRKYPCGREVIVYVNPRNAGDSVLEPGRQYVMAICYVLIGLGLCAVAYFVLKNP